MRRGSVVEPTIDSAFLCVCVRTKVACAGAGPEVGGPGEGGQGGPIGQNRRFQRSARVFLVIPFSLLNLVDTHPRFTTILSPPTGPPISSVPPTTETLRSLRSCVIDPCAVGEAAGQDDAAALEDGGPRHQVHTHSGPLPLILPTTRPRLSQAWPCLHVAYGEHIGIFGHPCRYCFA